MMKYWYFLTWLRGARGRTLVLEASGHTAIAVTAHEAGQPVARAQGLVPNLVADELLGKLQKTVL
jgi:hypothetical protein